MTEQEIRRLVENSEAPIRHIILVELNTGMRKAEVLNLEWEQVNLEEGFRFHDLRHTFATYALFKTGV